MAWHLVFFALNELSIGSNDEKVIQLINHNEILKKSYMKITSVWTIMNLRGGNRTWNINNTDSHTLNFRLDGWQLDIKIELSESGYTKRILQTRSFSIKLITAQIRVTSYLKYFDFFFFLSALVWSHVHNQKEMVKEIKVEIAVFFRKKKSSIEWLIQIHLKVRLQP